MYLIAGLTITSILMAYKIKTAIADSYSQGWSDAQCGKNVDCEAGQE